MRNGAGRVIEKLRRSQPISRVLSWTVIHLGRTSQYASCDLPGSHADHTCETNLAAPLFGLAPDGVYPAASVAGSAVRSYHTISPLPQGRCPCGGIFSVALSVGSRPPGVTWRPVLWSPDFPPFRRKVETATAWPTPAAESSEVAGSWLLSQICRASLGACQLITTVQASLSNSVDRPVFCRVVERVGLL